MRILEKIAHYTKIACEVGLVGLSIASLITPAAGIGIAVIIVAGICALSTIAEDEVKEPDPINIHIVRDGDIIDRDDEGYFSSGESDDISLVSENASITSFSTDNPDQIETIGDSYIIITEV